MTLASIRAHIKQFTKYNNLTVKLSFKTTGNTGIGGSKLYALYVDGKRYSPFYSIKGWNEYKLDMFLESL